MVPLLHTLHPSMPNASLFSIRKVVLEKDIFKKSLTYFHIFSYLPLGKKLTKKHEFPSHRDALWQVWLKVAKVVLDKKNFKPHTRILHVTMYIVLSPLSLKIIEMSQVFIEKSLAYSHLVAIIATQWKYVNDIPLEKKRAFHSNKVEYL